MSNTLLRDTDQMSMAHALEIRVPVIDISVAQFVLGLPGAWKMNGKRPKPLLVDALGNLLPEEVWKRPKMGFTLPFQRWLRSALKNEMQETFSSDVGMNRLGIRSDHARAIWHSFDRNAQREPWSKPWALYVLKKWCDLHHVA
jgi:asparagine synthase (glutamine-hydrolysing)